MSSNGPVTLTDEQLEALAEVALDVEERIAREDAAAAALQDSA